MGLDVSHDCWHGAYSAFHRWRSEIAKHYGIPLDFMEGFYDPDHSSFQIAKQIYNDDRDNLNKPCHYEKWFMGIKLGTLMQVLPLKWSSFKYDPIHELLYHSDCDGYINYGAAGKIAKSLESIIDKLPKDEDRGHIHDWKNTTQKFIDGLKLAHSLKQRVKFH